MTSLFYFRIFSLLEICERLPLGMGHNQQDCNKSSVITTRTNSSAIKKP